MGRSVTKGPAKGHRLIQLSAVSAGLWPMLSLGLGLGEIQLDSRLNQPLRVRIEVLDVNDDEWAQLHASLNWQNAPDTYLVRPDFLNGVVVRTIEDQSHRRFVEVRSPRSIVEPLFDLPVEVVGPSGHLIRSYSVLLDPPAPGDDRPGATDAPRIVSTSPPVATEPGLTSATVGSRSSGTLSGQQAAGNRELSSDTGMTSPAVRRHAAHKHTRPAREQSASDSNRAQAGDRDTSRKTSSSTRTSLDATPAPAARGSSRQELLQRLEVLQQTLAQVQETIAARDAQIAALTARIAARERLQAERSAPVTRPQAQPGTPGKTANAEATRSERHEPGVRSAPRSYSWLSLVLGLATIAAIAWAIFNRWRLSRSAGKLPPGQPVEQQAMPENRVTARSEDALRRQPPALGVMTPAAQQRQMEADGRIQIDWGKEQQWSRPESTALASAPVPAALETHADGHEASEHEESIDTATDYLEELPNAYFGDLPKAAAIPETLTAELRGLDTSILASAHGDAIGEGGDTTEMLQPDISQLSESQTALLLVEDPANPTRSDLTHMSEADLLELIEADATQSANTGSSELAPTQAPDPSEIPRRAGQRR